MNRMYQLEVSSLYIFSRVAIIHGFIRGTWGCKMMGHFHARRYEMEPSLIDKAYQTEYGELRYGVMDRMSESHVLNSKSDDAVDIDELTVVGNT